MSYNGLAVLIGESPRTIQRGVTWLVRAGLFEVTFRRGKLFRLKPLTAHEEWFREKKSLENMPPVPTEGAPLIPQPKPQVGQSAEQKLYDYHRRIGMSHDRAKFVESWTRKRYKIDDSEVLPLWQLDLLEEEAKSQHKKSGRCPSHAGLYFWKILHCLLKQELITEAEVKQLGGMK